MNDFFQERIKVLKAMHLIVKNMNNEKAYAHWTEYGMCDNPTEEDFQDVARDWFEEAGSIFNEVVRLYGKEGY